MCSFLVLFNDLENREMIIIVNMFDYGESDIVHLLLRAFFSYILLTFNLNSNDPLVSPSDILHFHSIYSHSFQFKIISATAGQSYLR